MLKKIVLVEDNEDNRLLVNAILEGLYEIIEYETGIEAIEKLASSKADLVLLDISLPGKDGIEVVKWIRTQPLLKLLPVIALTAHAMEGTRKMLIGHGFTDYLMKPIIDENNLLDTLKKFLN
ncbi:MAG: response regulator [Planctomycetota bacterium]